MHIDNKKYKIETKKNIQTKIVHISDIHYSKKYNTKILDKVTKEIEQHNPNYICITGDLIDTYNVTKTKEFEYFINWLKKLSEIAKVIITPGNHEYVLYKDNKFIYHNDINWLKNIDKNITLLNNDILELDDITFIGFNPSYKFYYKDKEKNKEKTTLLSELINKVNTKYNILLLHTPSFITKNNNYKNIENYSKLDLILCGHTHGGLIPSFIPGNFGIISPNKELFPKNVRGKLKVGNKNLIISSGVIKLSEKSKLMKFNNIYGINVNLIHISNKI